MISLLDLLKKKSEPRTATDPALTDAQSGLLLPLLPGWQKTGQEIHKTFTFMNFHETMAFVNAVAFVAHQQDHHPNLEVSYAKVRVRYSTHTVNGLSDNDFICAAHVQALQTPSW